ncbi:MAG: 4Fe-4S dicluster domain-containing protein [Candidatus Lokiarchaeota archaeon]|nr:4Fe-4S dicluster domain-containing protein [Candidatus Lokiarchaeota archaeon]
MSNAKTVEEEEEKIIKTMDVTEDMDFVYEFKSPNLDKVLLHKPDLCTGCGICVDICPSDAIELGPISEIATGEIEAPYIMIDQDKCDYCGICTLCPLNAMEFYFEDENIKEDDKSYPKLKTSHKLDEEKCVKCFLCEEVCPRDVIEADLNVKKKEDIVKYPKGVSFKDLELKGNIEIDLEKCTYCKLCDKLCDALEIVPYEVSPLNIYGGRRIEVYEDECDYCGLCQEICPVDAIKVSCDSKVDRQIGELSVEGEIKVNEDECIYCDWCGTVCFVDAIEVEKPIEGEITLQRLEYCDPSGCKACINICPTKAWYIPKQKDQKIAVDDRFCIYCGSCELSCCENCIIVDRENVKHTEFDTGKPWAVSWKKALQIIEGLQEEKVSRLIPIEEKEEVKKISHKIKEIPKVEPEIWQKFQEKLDDLLVILGRAPVRYYLEGKKDKKPKIKVEQ